jgi:hypothetical protein
MIVISINYSYVDSLYFFRQKAMYFDLDVENVINR